MQEKLEFSDAHTERDDSDRERAPRFAAVISNPPYQGEKNPRRNATSAIYHQFAKQAQLIGDTVSMIYPARWTLNGVGEGLQEFRQRELHSTQYEQYEEISDASEVFGTALICGGLCHFVWNAEKTDPALRYIYDGHESVRHTIADGREHYVRGERDGQIVDRFGTLSRSIADLSYGQSYFGGFIYNRRAVAALPEYKESDAVRVLYIGYTGGTHLAAKTVHPEWIKNPADHYGVSASITANGNGEGLLNRLDRLFIVEPGEATSKSFILLGRFDTYGEALALLQYLKSDLATYLVGLMTITQNVSTASFDLIPAVDFGTGQIIGTEHVLDFGTPETLDDQLAAIYGLADDDRAHMARRVKPWQDKLSATADRGR